MQTVFLTKVIKVGSSHGVIIPVPILNGMKWERGDLLVYGFGGVDQIFLKRVTEKNILEMKPDIKF